jgi:hypothetical protein
MRSGIIKKRVPSAKPHTNPSQDGGRHSPAPEDVLAGSAISSKDQTDDLIEAPVVGERGTHEKLQLKDSVH